MCPHALFSQAQSHIVIDNHFITCLPNAKELSFFSVVNCQLTTACIAQVTAN